MKQTILGAGGAIGTELAKALTAYTTDIRLVSRHPKAVNPNDSLLVADLTKKEDVFQAVEGSAVTYVTVGFPYQLSYWQQHWLPMMQNVVAACLQYNSKLVFFDNVYTIGGNDVQHITETSPMQPTSRKGAVRAAINQLLLDSIKEQSLQAIIARSPDFFGGTAKDSSIVINLVYNNLRKGKKSQWLCNAHKIHSMGYVPDLAKGTALLGNTADAFNQIWNLPVDPQKITGEEWVGLFAEAMGSNQRSYTTLPNWLIRTLGIFVPMMKELAEMNYQYDRDYYFDSSKFMSSFNYQPTPNALAVKQAIAQLGDG